MSIAYNPSPRIPPSTLGLRLQQARDWRNYTQTDLAEVLDVSRGTISNFERGVTSPSKLEVNAWAAFCDVDVDWLKTGNESTEAPDGGNSAVTGLYQHNRKSHNGGVILRLSTPTLGDTRPNEEAA